MKKFLFLLVFSLIIVNAAFAGDDQDKSLLVKKLDTIVVTPSRYEESSLDVDKSITVIDEEKIKNSHARYVPELLKNEAGINVRSTLGNGKAVEVDMRGFGESSPSNVLVLVNGRRTNLIDISGVDWTQISIDSIERIEIVRGAQTVLYGDNATGGVINIITKNGNGKKPELGLEYKSGSYRYNGYSGYIDGGNKFLDYFSSLSYSNTIGYRTNNSLELTDFNGNTTLKPTDNIHLRLDGGYHKDRYGLPGALKPADIDRVGWRGSIHPNDRSKTNDYYLRAGPDIKYDSDLVGVLLTGDVLYRSRKTDSIFYSLFGNTENNSHIRTLGMTPKAVVTNEFYNVSNRIIAGLDYYNNRDQISSSDLAVGGYDLINIEKDSLGLYLTDVIELFRSLALNAGARGEWVGYRFDQQTMINGLSTKREFEYAAEAGINYKYNEKSALYASYSRSFRFPAVDEWYSAMINYGFGPTGGLNLDLVPQVANNYEIGIKENSSKYLSIKADYYIMDIKHELYYNPVTFANAIYDRTMHHGLELEAHTYLLDKLDCFANYTYQKAFFVGSSFAGNDIPMVPRHKFSSGFDYKFLDCVKVGYVANFVGLRRFISDQGNNMPRLKSYLTHDIKLSYYKYNLEIYGAIYNIFNERYSEEGVLDFTRTVPGYYPSPGANYTVGAKYKF